MSALSRTIYVRFVLVIGCMTAMCAVAVAQSRDDRLDRARSPLSAFGAEVRRQTRQDAGTSQPAQMGPPAPVRMRPGHYVVPAPYSADYFSPTLRAFPDYAPPRDRSYPSGPRLDDRYDYRGAGGYYYHPFDGYGYGAGVQDAEAAYNQGQYDALHDYLWYISSERGGALVIVNRKLVEQGLEQFRSGRYERSVVTWLGAAEQNQADSASRIYAGHALFAMSKYGEAVRQIARAFELSPSLVYTDYDIRDDYGDKHDFDDHLAVLKERLEAHPDDVSALTMMGYVSYYTSGPSTSFAFLDKAQRLTTDPQEYFIPKLLKLARLTNTDDARTSSVTRTRAVREAPKALPEPVRSPSKRNAAGEEVLGGRMIVKRIPSNRG